MNERKIYKPKPISGFPEWLPAVRRIEQRWFDQIRRVFESYGYASIETPSVEELDVITAKGEDVDKEIYVLERLQKEDGDTREARLALHFDQTVPMARYVAQHFNDLTFPFKRYQIQKVWRGERPQAGRMREFYQCDIDVINVDNLPLHFDAEMPAVIWEILNNLPGMEKQKIQLRISNRKILTSVIATYITSNSQDHLAKIATALSLIDKIEKVGEDKVAQGLIEQCDLQADRIEYLIRAVKKKAKNSAEVDEWKNLPGLAATPSFIEGINELKFVMDNLSHLPENAVVADLSIVRGLAYYTGTVYETVFVDDPGYGSICSGGRYDDLAGNYINKHLPGVGISIGFTRLFDRLRNQGLLPLEGSAPTHALILLLDEAQRSVAAAKAHDLRAQGFNIELFHADSKIQKQFAYAEKKGIPFAFVPMEDGSWQVKNMQARTQASEKDGIEEMRKYVQARS